MVNDMLTRRSTISPECFPHGRSHNNVGILNLKEVIDFCVSCQLLAAQPQRSKLLFPVFIPLAAQSFDGGHWEGCKTALSITITKWPFVIDFPWRQSAYCIQLWHFSRALRSPSVIGWWLAQTALFYQSQLGHKPQSSYLCKGPVNS